MNATTAIRTVVATAIAALAVAVPASADITAPSDPTHFSCKLYDADDKVIHKPHGSTRVNGGITYKCVDGDWVPQPAPGPGPAPGVKAQPLAGATADGIRR